MYLLESKLYIDKIINNITKKIGDSKEIKDKLQIFGLFRDQYPFNTIKDVNRISSETELDKIFKTWYEYVLDKLRASKGAFEGNRKAIEIYLNAYIKNINSLKEKAKPFSFKDYEDTLIKLSDDNYWVETKVSEISIDKPLKEDVVFESDQFLILHPKTEESCISYGKGYEWCISSSNKNKFHSYLLTNITIYFVYNKYALSTLHKLVIITVDHQGHLGLGNSENKVLNGEISYASVEMLSTIHPSYAYLQEIEKYFKFVEDDQFANFRDELSKISLDKIEDLMDAIKDFENKYNVSDDNILHTFIKIALDKKYVFTYKQIKKLPAYEKEELFKRFLYKDFKSLNEDDGARFIFNLIATNSSFNSIGDYVNDVNKNILDKVISLIKKSDKTKQHSELYISLVNFIFKGELEDINFFGKIGQIHRSLSLMFFNKNENISKEHKEKILNDLYKKTGEPLVKEYLNSKFR